MYRNVSPNVNQATELDLSLCEVHNVHFRSSGKTQWRVRTGELNLAVLNSLAAKTMNDRKFMESWRSNFLVRQAPKQSKQLLKVY